MYNEFTKEMLLTGDIVVTGCGEPGVIILEKDIVLYQKANYDCLDMFNDDLTSIDEDPDWDIVKVYRDSEPMGFYDYKDWEPIYEREYTEEFQMARAKRIEEQNRQYEALKDAQKRMMEREEKMSEEDKNLSILIKFHTVEESLKWQKMREDDLGKQIRFLFESITNLPEKYADGIREMGRYHWKYNGLSFNEKELLNNPDQIRKLTARIQQDINICMSIFSVEGRIFERCLSLYGKDYSRMTEKEQKAISDLYGTMKQTIESIDHDYLGWIAEKAE